MEGNVVETIYSDGATVYICDDYCRDKTPEDVDKILKSIVEQFTEYLQVQNSPEGRAERMARQGRVREEARKILIEKKGNVRNIHVAAVSEKAECSFAEVQEAFHYFQTSPEQAEFRERYFRREALGKTEDRRKGQQRKRRGR